MRFTVPVLITGSTGRLGQEIALLRHHGYPVVRAGKGCCHTRFTRHFQARTADSSTTTLRLNHKRNNSLYMPCSH